MTRWRLSSRVVVVLATSILIAACSDSTPTPSATQSADATPRGGTLHVEGWQFPFGPAPDRLDPQLTQWVQDAEIFRCCLARTLLSHLGKPTNEGGAELRPDLAAAMPKISGDGKAWTFRIRAGLTYAPPLHGVEITAADFVRALERTARINGAVEGSLSYLYSVIEGYDDYAHGKRDSIAGLETPDPHTLIVRLTNATGDLGDRLALSPASPVPPLRAQPTAQFGAATGHDDGDGRFLVSTGPYMIEGSEKLDFSLPPAQQQPLGGFSPASLTLVRNPSWRAAEDPLRPAYVDRIEYKTLPLDNFYSVAAADIDSGRADLAVNTIRPPQISSEEAVKYGNGSTLGKLATYPRDSVWGVNLNLAVPPFDDVHVRRAVSEVIDREAQLRLFGGADNGTITGHLALDSVEGNVLSAFDPFRSPGDRGSVANALAEMKQQSKYAVDQTGMCAASVCSHVRAITPNYDDPAGVHHFAMMAAAVASDLAKIGIHLDLALIDLSTCVNGTCYDPTQHVALVTDGGFGKIYLNGSDFFVNGLSGQVAGAGDPSLLGATPDKLRGWGYTVTSVPSIDTRINECLALTGAEQTRCWTALDTYTTEQIVPIVPLISDKLVWVVPRRVVHYSYDQMFTSPAFDQMALAH